MNIKIHNSVVAPSKLELKSTWLLGVICTMNGLMIFGIAAYNYVIAVYILARIIRGDFFNISLSDKVGRLSALFLLSSATSNLLNLNYLPENWVLNGLTVLLKFSLMLSFYFIFNNVESREELSIEFFDGLYLGCIIQAIWGYCQIIFGFIGIELNTLIFQDVLGITGYTWDSYVAGGLLRMKGIGWEAANFSLAMIVGFLLAERKKEAPIIRFIFLAALVLSTSRTGYVGFLAVMAYKIVKRTRKHRLKKWKHEHILSMLLVGLILLSCIFYLSDYITQLLTNQIESFIDILNFAPDRITRSSSDIHMQYYSDIPQLYRYITIIQILFGAGFFSVGFTYSMFDSYLLSRIDMLGWNPESDFVTLLIGNGLLFTLYFYSSIMYSLFKSKNCIWAQLIVAVLACGVTYLELRGTWPLLILLFSLNSIEQDSNQNV